MLGVIVSLIYMLVKFSHLYTTTYERSNNKGDHLPNGVRLCKNVAKVHRIKAGHLQTVKAKISAQHDASIEARGVYYAFSMCDAGDM